MVEWNPTRNRTLERTRTNADPCHSCHGAEPSRLVLRRKCPYLGHEFSDGDPCTPQSLPVDLEPGGDAVLSGRLVALTPAAGPARDPGLVRDDVG